MKSGEKSFMKVKRPGLTVKIIILIKEALVILIFPFQHKGELVSIMIYCGAVLYQIEGIFHCFAGILRQG